nr:limonoid UDP-glucosyltransferase-like [Ipomoea batatas]
MGSENGGVPPLHVFMVSFPGQGHVNPLLRLGKRLAGKGLLVTFSAPEHVGVEMRKANSKISEEPTPYGDGFIRFEFFDDEFDPCGPHGTDLDFQLDQMERVGSVKLSGILDKHEKQGRPVSCLINNPFIPWVSDVAEKHGIPSAVLWVQSCASFSAYYHYQNKLVPFPTETEPFLDVQLPCMPLLKYDEFPSFLHPSSQYKFLARAILHQFANLSKPFRVLMETFQELEPEVIEYMSKLCPIKPVGPLFLTHGGAAGAADVRGDFVKVDNCTEWLDSKAESSVVYISFGSIVILKQEQVDEIAHGLMNSGLSFLWVRKPPPPAFSPTVLPDGFLEKVGDNGKVVQWCSQEQVLAHPSVACFMTHCGWNSSMEAITSGVAVVAFPGWGDQVTDAKFLVDVFKIGVRLSRGDAEGRIITRDEVEKCLIEATRGEKAAEMKENALKWKKKAEEAVAPGGSSDRNLEEFVDEIRNKCGGGKH